MAKEHRTQIIAAQTSNNNQRIDFEVEYFEKGNRQDIVDRSIESQPVDDFKGNELVRGIRQKLKDMNKRAVDTDAIIAEYLNVRIDEDGVIERPAEKAGE